MLSDFFLKQKAKSKLLQALRIGEIYRTYKSGQKLHYIMPKIHAVDIKSNKLAYVFSIPLGLDPKEVHKKKWVFEQQFGENLDLKQANKRFTLTIYNITLPEKVNWTYEKFIEDFEGHIPIVCGVDIYGQPRVYELVEHPHLLIAGFTGSGKSTQLRSILTFLIKYFTPEQLHLYLIDMKAVELALFRRVAHVKGDVITKSKKVKPLLAKFEKEMDRRQNLMEKEGVTHITQLKNKEPFIVIAIDELASLPNDKELDEYLVEISNRGRALGVYLILSILRPDSVNMDSRLKGNMTVTMGFKARDKINARVIGMQGSEKIKITGRFLMNFPGEEENIELQAPKLDEGPLKKILKEYQIEKTVDPLERVEEVKQPEQIKKEELFGVLDE